MSLVTAGLGRPGGSLVTGGLGRYAAAASLYVMGTGWQPVHDLWLYHGGWVRPVALYVRKADVWRRIWGQ